MATRGSFSDYAAHRGVSPAYVTKLKKDGRLVIVKGEGGRDLVDFELSDRLVRNTADMGRENNGANARGKDQPAPERLAPAPGPDSRVDAVFRQAQAKERAFAAQMAELQFGKAAGRLVERARVEAAVFDAFRSIRDRILAVPRRCAPTLLGLVEVREIELAITDELRRALGPDEAAAVQAIQAKVLQ